MINLVEYSSISSENQASFEDLIRNHSMILSKLAIPLNSANDIGSRTTSYLKFLQKLVKLFSSNLLREYLKLCQKIFFHTSSCFLRNSSNSSFNEVFRGKAQKSQRNGSLFNLGILLLLFFQSIRKLLLSKFCKDSFETF